jgi:hypothetical protein
MFKHVVNAKYIEDYKIWIAFNDGKEGEINFAEKLSKKSGVFELLKDVNYFKNFKIINDTLSWENGADFAPESLYELIK